MKNLKIGLIAAAAVAILGATPALAQQFYVGGHGGLNYTHEASTGGGDKIAYDFFGLGIGVEVGMRIGSNLRVEGELTYRSNDVDEVDGVSTTAEMTSTTLMVNALYDFNSESGLTPYIGGGLGMSSVEFSISTSSFDDTVLAAQLIGGVMFELSPGLTMSVDYRLFGTQDLALGAGFGFGDVEYINSSVFVGIKKFF